MLLDIFKLLVPNSPQLCSQNSKNMHAVRQGNDSAATPKAWAIDSRHAFPMLHVKEKTKGTTGGVVSVLLANRCWFMHSADRFCVEKVTPWDEPMETCTWNINDTSGFEA